MTTDMTSDLTSNLTDQGTRENSMERTRDVVGKVRPPMAPAHRVIELALTAPSVHNTQPWLWRVVDDRIELYADRSRQLQVADPSGRNLTISCGAALHHLQVAAAALGWPAEVTRMPDPENPDHLATITLRPGYPTPRAESELAALRNRRTDRRRFTSWPVPPERLNHLAASVSGPGVQVVPLTDVSERFRVELLVSRAMTIEAADHRFADEQAAWVDHSPVDGIPDSALPPVNGRRPIRPSRFAGVPDPPPDGPLEASDGLLVVCTDGDSPESWLWTGELLCRLWTEAMEEGLSLVPLSQVVEVAETRSVLYHDILGGLVHPQILVRIGWQEIARSPQPATPRRPLADVLLA